VRHVILATIALLSTTSPVRAQGVLIAPQAIVVGDDGTATLTIINPDTKRVEITFSTMYGYPITDDRGQLKLQTFAAVADTMPSAAEWITAYPRRFTLGAGQRQTVRLLVSPPPAAPTGEYWARLVVSSKGALPEQVVATADSSAPVTMRLDLEVRSVLPLLYRRGAVATSLTIDDVATDQTADSLGVRPMLQRGGNAAWVGTVSVGLRDGSNAEVRRFELPMAVYYSLAPRLALPLGGLPAGRYTLEVHAVATRQDLPRHQVLASAPRVYRTEIRVP
jgi:P pilus assembly chaperone PapD